MKVFAESEIETSPVPPGCGKLESLENRDRDIIEAAIERFVRTGQGDVKKLAGAERDMRLRAGDWRIRFVFEPSDAIRILHIRNRRDAYR